MCPILGNTENKTDFVVQYRGWIPVLPLSSCVALGKLLNFSELPAIHLSNEHNNINSVGLLEGEKDELR